MFRSMNPLLFLSIIDQEILILHASSMEYYQDVSIWRRFCDKYMDSRLCEAGGGTRYAESQMPDVRDLAQKALDDYNLKEQKNFALERIAKLNTFVTCYSMTFWAVANETGDRRLLRGVVNLLGQRAVLLCEIKEDEVGACSYVATVACIEMLYRIIQHNIPNWSQIYYFDVEDPIDNLYKKYPNLPDAIGKLKDVDLNSGTRIPHIMQYIRDYGLLATSECRNARPRNLLSHFDAEAPRYKIKSYIVLKAGEVIDVSKRFPIVVVLFAYKSFRYCTQLIYNGPTEEEIKNRKDETKPKVYPHTVLIVGSCTFGTQDYVLIQNSYGDGFGFRGFCLLPFDIIDVFLEFYIPVIRSFREMNLPERLSRRLHETSTQGETSKRQRQ